MKRHLFAALVALSPILATPPALADGCPTAPDHRAALDDLLSQIQSARNDAEGQILSNRMWELWLDAPDEPSAEMLRQGMSARRVSDYARALSAFDRLVSYCPFYAEGYNQRAFINFLAENYAAALPDLDQALAIDPKHVGALSGKALTLLRMGRIEEGQAALRAAVALNPWLGERFLLAEPEGEDL